MREKEYIGKRYGAILSSVGMILVLCGMVMLTPLLVMIWYPQQTQHIPAFALPAG